MAMLGASCSKCCGCGICYAQFTRVNSGRSEGVIQVRQGSVSVIVTGGPIANIGGNQFNGPAYQWPDSCVASSHVALSDPSEFKTYNIAFSSSVNRIVMPIVSLGAFLARVVDITVEWRFSADVSIISQGAHAQFGQCPAPGTCLQASGSTLRGREGSGIVEFYGSFSNLSLTVVSRSENWNSFGIGIPCDTNPSEISCGFGTCCGPDAAIDQPQYPRCRGLGSFGFPTVAARKAECDRIGGTYTECANCITYGPNGFLRCEANPLP